MAPAHTHTHTHTHTHRERKERVREKGRTDTTPPPPRRGLFLLFTGRLFDEGVSSSRRRKQTDVLFANPGEEEKIPVARQGNGC
jgi:hypothetical protein